MLAIWIAAAVAAFALGLVLFAPLEIDLRAPDSGDLGTLKIEHAVVELEIWLPPDVALAWALGEAALPPIVGHVFGIPVDRALVRRWMGRGSRGAARVRKARAPAGDAPRTATRVTRVDADRDPVAALLPDRLRAPAHVARAAWKKQKARVKRAGRVEVFEVDLRYGTGNPAITGMLAGFFWELAASLPAPFALRAEADWTRLTVGFEGEARVIVFPWRALFAAVCLAASGWREWRVISRPRYDEGVKTWQKTETAAPSKTS